MMVAQDVKYVATANAAYPQDLFDKIKRAATEFNGHFRYIEIYSPCPPGWDVDTRDIVEVGKLANEIGLCPAWEAVDGTIEFSRISRRFKNPEKRKDPEEFFKLQGRFTNVDPILLGLLEEDVLHEWNWLKRFMS